jgi:riboflavin synthase
MFTGLIESVCPVKAAHRSGAAGMALAVDLGSLSQGTQVGDSIAVSGVCLTVTRMAGTVAHFDLSPETLSRSSLGALRPSTGVNVERALQIGDRFGGHIVLGHVDGVALVGAVRRRGGFLDMAFDTGAGLLDQMVVKGSVAVDGVSLTVAGLDKAGFSVAIVPETASATTLGAAAVGDRVNIETDLIVKAVRRCLEGILSPRSGLTADTLASAGF